MSPVSLSALVRQRAVHARLSGKYGGVYCTIPCSAERTFWLFVLSLSNEPALEW
jgi:hypothetical protein